MSCAGLAPGSLIGAVAPAGPVDGAIRLEDVDEAACRVDRLLTRLRLAGLRVALDAQAGTLTRREDLLAAG